MSYLRRPDDPQNRYRRWIDPRYRTLRLSVVVVYLRHRGWQPLPPDRTGALAFQEPTGEMVDGRPVCPFAPDSEEYNDYPMGMFERIAGLVEFEDRQDAEVIDDILCVASGEPPGGTSPRAGRPAEIAVR